MSTQISFEGIKVVVIDSLTIRRIVEMLLKKVGCEVITATDGFESLAKIMEHQPDIIFVELRPKIFVEPRRLDGFQTCALIKSNPAFKKIPVVILSSWDGLFQRAYSKIVGADHYMTKPFTREELFNAVKTYVVDAKTAGERITKTPTHIEEVAEHLETEEDMTAHLDAALRENDPALVVAALSNIARAKGMTQMAGDTGLGRDNLQALSSGSPLELADRIKSGTGARTETTRQRYLKKVVSGISRVGCVLRTIMLVCRNEKNALLQWRQYTIMNAKINFEGIKVVVIDDSNTIRCTAKALLKKAGCEVITATDGFESLATVMKHQPDIIFVDLMMPRLDGFQTCALIKNHPAFKKIPVVMLSGVDSLRHRAKSRMVGFDHYMTKPFNREGLLNVIKTYVIDAKTAGERITKTPSHFGEVVEHLETEEDMTAHLDAALRENDSALVAVALSDIARAKGMMQMVGEPDLGRESFYQALSSEGHPEFATVLNVVHALGLKLYASVIPKVSSEVYPL